MSTRYNTGNPIESTDVRDMSDNAKNFDEFSNSMSDSFSDRFGLDRQTIEGSIRKAGFQPAPFDFVTGGTLVPGDRNKAVFNPSPSGDDNWYAWQGALPKVISPSSTPATTGGFGEIAWKPVTNNILAPTVREAIRRSYAEAGYNLVNGSFEAGGTLVNANDVLLQEFTGKAFSGPAGTCPAGTPTSGFIDASEAISRTFDTVARMLSSGGSLVVGQKVRWLGYHEISDGGSGCGIVKIGAHVDDGGSVFSLGVGLYVEASLKGGRVSIKKFGARGDGVTLDQTAIENAVAYVESTSGVSTVYIPPPDVSYITNAEIAVTVSNKGIKGEGKTSVIEYTGGAGNVMFLGSKDPTPEVFSRNQFISGVFLKVRNKIDTISGLVLERCIHYSLDDISITGGGSPNENIPLNGAGLHVSKVSFIGRMRKLDISLFDIGILISTPGALTYDAGWAAALVVSGQGEIQNNNVGILLAGTGGNAAGSSVSIRDITVEGNYQGGIRATAGNNIVIDTVYFELNAGYNIDIDNTVSTTIKNCHSVADPLLVTPYGPVSYGGHVLVRGGNTLTRVKDNNLVIQGGDYSAVVVNSGANSTRIKGNRIAGTPATFKKIRDEASNTIVKDNLGVDDLEWITPSKSNGWIDVPGRPVVQFALDKTSSKRRVLFRGVCGLGTPGSEAFKINADMYPLDRYDFTGVQNNKITITSSGSVLITSATSEVSFASVGYQM